MINRLDYRARAAFLSSATLFAFAFAAPAAAQSQQPTSPPRDQNVSNDTGEEIVITAQKRAEVLLNIPQSVSVVGGDTLDRQQAKNIQDFANLVPGP